MDVKRRAGGGEGRHAATAMLATRVVSFERTANLAETMGADIKLVRQGIGSTRASAGTSLYAGCGYGGSCFPGCEGAHQDRSEHGHKLWVLAAVEDANDAQKHVLLERSSSGPGKDLAGHAFRPVGLASSQHRRHARCASRVIIVELIAAAPRCRPTIRWRWWSPSGIFGDEPARLRGSSEERPRGCGCTRDRDRVEGIPQSGFRVRSRRASSSPWCSTVATCTTPR